LTTDVPGTVRGSLETAPGQDLFVSGTADEIAWEALNTVALDPNNQSQFWVLGAYTLPRDVTSGNGQWGQRWFGFMLPARVFPVHG
jgi:hypothetical protein